MYFALFFGKKLSSWRVAPAETETVGIGKVFLRFGSIRFASIRNLVASDRIAN